MSPDLQKFAPANGFWTRQSRVKSITIFDSRSTLEPCMTELVFEVDDLIVHFFCDDVDAVLALDEAQHRGIHLGGPYSAIYHKAHTNPGEDHIQVYMKNNQTTSCSL